MGGVNATNRSNPWIGADSLATCFFGVVARCSLYMLQCESLTSKSAQTQI